MSAANDRALAEDVVLLYEGALGRTPSRDELDHHLAQAPDLRTLVQAIFGSEEHRLRCAALNDSSATTAVAQADARAISTMTPSGASWADRFPAPERPWTPGYAATHVALVAAAIDDAELCAAVAGVDLLPAGYAVGYDERTVEYPWLFGHSFDGRVLDAGSTLNHPHVLDRALQRVDDLTILTLAPEHQAFPLRGVSYVFGDMRDMPFRDGWFDTAVSVSTFEHIGTDNSRYGVDADAAQDPDREMALAAGELRRVVRPGGRILVSVPYGRREDHGWFRQFDAEDVERLIAAFHPRRHSVTLFRYTADGWQRSSADEAAGLRYRDAQADPTPVADLAAAARGVACLVIDI